MYSGLSTLTTDGVVAPAPVTCSTSAPLTARRMSCVPARYQPEPVSLAKEWLGAAADPLGIRMADQLNGDTMMILLVQTISCVPAGIATAVPLGVLNLSAKPPVNELVTSHRSEEHTSELQSRFGIS